jgi:drug/metabolite transporter (DMT)-like permease
MGRGEGMSTTAAAAASIADARPLPRPAGRAYVLLTLTALAWGAHTVFGRLAVGQVSPMALVALRWMSVCVLLCAFASRSLRADWPLLRPRLPYLGAMGALGFGVYNALYYSAAHLTSAVNMGIVQGAIPVFVVAGALVVDSMRITAAQGLGIALSLIGVAVVASAGDLTRILALTVNLGDLFMLVGCMLYAGYTLALRRAPAVSPFAMLAVLAGAAFVAALPMAAAEWATGRLRWPTQFGWMLVLVIAVVPSLLAQSFFIRGVRLIGPERAGVFVNLVPVFAAIMGVTFLSEAFETYHAVALGLVLAGIWLSERRFGLQGPPAIGGAAPPSRT